VRHESADDGDERQNNGNSIEYPSCREASHSRSLLADIEKPSKI
jgi:hypothetical protein